MPRTLEEIRTLGLAALRERLGRAGMIRFLQQFENGSGDYAATRRDADRLLLTPNQFHHARVPSGEANFAPPRKSLQTRDG